MTTNFRRLIPDLFDENGNYHKHFGNKPFPYCFGNGAGITFFPTSTASGVNFSFARSRPDSEGFNGWYMKTKDIRELIAQLLYVLEEMEEKGSKIPELPNSPLPFGVVEVTPEQEEEFPEYDDQEPIF